MKQEEADRLADLIPQEIPAATATVERSHNGQHWRICAVLRSEIYGTRAKRLFRPEEWQPLKETWLMLLEDEQ